jgi:hypothetical protein
MLFTEARVVTDRSGRTSSSSAGTSGSVHADRLEQVGRRDRLTVTWTSLEAAGEQPPSPARRPERR